MPVPVRFDDRHQWPLGSGLERRDVVSDGVEIDDDLSASRLGGVHPGQFPIAAKLADMGFEMTDQVRRRLTEDTLVWLTTVSPSGRPAPRLVWFMWTGQDCLVYSQPGAAKLRHIASNHRVTLNFNSDSHGGDAVVLAGRAELGPDAPPPEDLPGLLDKYAGLLDAIGMTAEEFTSSYTVAIRVTLDRAWTVPA